MWTKPAATEMRFGFEVTMYVMNKQYILCIYTPHAYRRSATLWGFIFYGLANDVFYGSCYRGQYTYS